MSDLLNRRHVCLLALVAVGILANCTSAPSDEGADQAAVSSNNPNERLLVSLKLSSYPTQMPALKAHDYDITGVNLNKSQVDVLVVSSDLDQLKADGYEVVGIKHPDVETQTSGLTGYQTADTVQSKLKAYAAQYPSLAQMSSIGKSVQGRDIWVIRITKDVATPAATPKPVLLLNGMHHAREVMTPEVTLDTVDYLLTKYGTDPKVTHWVDANEIWVVPMLNVDGNSQVWGHDKMWRKNTHGCTSGNCPSSSGVDINRNYPYLFAACQGSSTDPSADDYHGPSAGSEPETQALMKLVEQIRPVFDISYHSYSEVVLYPTGCQGTHAATENVFKSIAEPMAAGIMGDDGVHPYQAGTPWELLYSVDGDDFDWMYTQYAVNGFGIEVNSDAQGFQPSFTTWRDKTVTKTRTAWQMLLDRLDTSGIRGLVHTTSSLALADATVAVSSSSAAAGTTGTQSRAINPDGSFHIVLLPGEYDITVSATGHAASTQHVTVAATRVDLDINLQ